MKCKSELFMLAEVFWRGQKNPLPFSKIPPSRRGGERKIQDKDSEISRLKMLGHHLQIKTLTAESDVIVVKDHGYGGENRSQ